MYERLQPRAFSEIPTCNSDFSRISPGKSLIEESSQPAQAGRMRPGHASLRRGRRSICGQLYLVTFATHARKRYFTSWAIASDASRLLAGLIATQGTVLHAWVLMPDHWHCLIELGEGADLSDHIGRCKGSASRFMRKWHPRLGRLWAQGFHDRAIRSTDDLKAVARYLVMNPVRAGLVGSISEYPFWDCVWVDGDRG